MYCHRITQQKRFTVNTNLLIQFDNLVIHKETLTTCSSNENNFQNFQMDKHIHISFLCNFLGSNKRNFSKLVPRKRMSSNQWSV